MSKRKTLIDENRDRTLREELRSILNYILNSGPVVFYFDDNKPFPYFLSHGNVIGLN